MYRQLKLQVNWLGMITVFVAELIGTAMRGHGVMIRPPARMSC